MPKQEKPDHGTTADQAAAAGIGQKDILPDLPSTAEGMIPNPMAPGIIAPVGDMIDDEGVTPSGDIPDEVDPRHGGLNNDHDLDTLDNEIKRFEH